MKHCYGSQCHELGGCTCGCEGCSLSKGYGYRAGEAPPVTHDEAVASANELSTLRTLTETQARELAELRTERDAALAVVATADVFVRSMAGGSFPRKFYDTFDPLLLAVSKLPMQVMAAALAAEKKMDAIYLPYAAPLRVLTAFLATLDGAAGGEASADEKGGRYGIWIRLEHWAVIDGGDDWFGSKEEMQKELEKCLEEVKGRPGVYYELRKVAGETKGGGG